MASNDPEGQFSIYTLKDVVILLLGHLHRPFGLKNASCQFVLSQCPCAGKDDLTHYLMQIQEVEAVDARLYVQPR